MGLLITGRTSLKSALGLSDEGMSLRSLVPPLLLALLACGGATTSKSTTPAASPAQALAQAPATAALLTKAPDQLQQADFSQAFETLGYELKSFSVSGRFTTVLGMQGDERLTIYLMQVAPEQVASEQSRLTARKGASKVDGGHLLGVVVEPEDKAKAQSMLTKLFGR